MIIGCCVYYSVMSNECQHTNAVLLRYQSRRVTAVCDDCAEHWTGPGGGMPGWVQDVVHDYVMAAQLMFDHNDNSAIQLYLKFKLEKASRALAGGDPLDALDRINFDDPMGVPLTNLEPSFR